VATINSRDSVDLIIEGDGWYPGDDIRVVKIVEYKNSFNGGLAYGLIYEGENLDRYNPSPFIIDPRVIWQVGDQIGGIR
jgi:hypothetical protein